VDGKSLAEHGKHEERSTPEDSCQVQGRAGFLPAFVWEMDDFRRVG
jgi:hypothetical protein